MGTKKLYRSGHGNLRLQSRPVPTQRKALLALIFGVLVISSSAIMTDLADAPGSVVSFYRMGIGTLVLAIPFASRWRRSAALSTRGLWLAVLAGVFFGLDLAAWATGITHAGATIPTLLGNMAPVWVGLGAWLIFKEKLKPGFWLGLAVALAGMIAVLQLDFGGAMQVNAGALFGVVSAFFYGAYMLVTQKGRDHLDALSFFWVAALSSTITLAVLILVLQDPLTGYSTFTYLNFIGLGVVVQGIAWLAINYAQGYLPASLVSPTLLIQPVLTAFLAGPLLGETFSLQQWLGGAAVLLGIIIVYRSRVVRTAVAESL
jgi:drug/metabolite transporter (DMT)-like permease